MSETYKPKPKPSDDPVDDLKARTERSKHDPIKHPSHYTRGIIEVWDFICDQDLNFCRGNVVKYVCRAGHKNKDEELHDLRKAQQYIGREIRRLEESG